jgi:hypothetical protein
MMLAWTFAARMIDEVARLVRAMGKHRYVREVDHRVHFTVDCALSDLPAFRDAARAFERDRPADLDLRSRDPRLWRAVSADEVVAVLTAFWAPDESGRARREKLVEVFADHALPVAEHEPFEADPESPPFPELVTLDWVFHPVDELDAEQHAGVLAALEDAGEEVAASEPVYVEGPSLSIVELCDGAPHGILPDDPYLWADGPRAYVDYVFRGVSKAAKLPEPPSGPDDESDDYE